MGKRFKLGGKYLGNGENTYFIADIAANHDGNLFRAKQLIELAKESGADAAKFQNFQAHKIVSKEGFDKMPQIAHQSQWKKSVYEVYEDASISFEWTEKLKEHCKKYDIEYFTSPYDKESINHVDEYVEAYKIGSGDITNYEILAEISKINKPIFIATGASTIDEVKAAINLINIHKNRETPLVIMQCNTNYTTSIDNFRYINLNVLRTYKKYFPDNLLGLSDHTQGHTTVLGAIALGAVCVEKHFTDDNSRTGPDHKFSMNPKTWSDMIKASRELEQALGSDIKKIEDNEIESSIVQKRGLYMSKDCKNGDIIETSFLEALRPAVKNSISPMDLNKIIGKKANKDLKKGECITWDDF